MILTNHNNCNLLKELYTELCDYMSSLVKPLCGLILWVPNALLFGTLVASEHFAESRGRREASLCETRY